MKSIDTLCFDKWELEKPLLPLSWSHISQFATKRPQWALQRIFGYKFPTNPAMERGSSVEHGLHMLLKGDTLENATKSMHYQYDEKLKNVFHNDIAKERNTLLPLLEAFYKYFEKQNWKLLSFQEEVLTTVIDIPVRGFTDFHFEDKDTKEDFYIDLKTSKTMPKSIPNAHAMQQSIYAKATNARQNLLYGTYYKTKPVEVVPFEVGNTNQYLKMVNHMVLSMEHYLLRMDSKEDIVKSIIPDPSDWWWNEESLVKARIKVWGY